MLPVFAQFKRVKPRSVVDIDGAGVGQIAKKTALAARARIEIENARQVIGQSSVGDEKIAGVAGRHGFQLECPAIAKAIGHANRGVAAAAVAPHPDGLPRLDVPPSRDWQLPVKTKKPGAVACGPRLSVQLTR